MDEQSTQQHTHTGQLLELRIVHFAALGHMFEYTRIIGNPRTGQSNAYPLLTCKASASASLYTATVATPMRLAVLITRHAISPLFAMRTLENISPPPTLQSVVVERSLIVARLAAGHLRSRGRRHWLWIVAPNTRAPRKAMVHFLAITDYYCGSLARILSTSALGHGDKKRGAITCFEL